MQDNIQADKYDALAAFHEAKAAEGHPNKAHYYARLAAGERARAKALREAGRGL